jgi:hypothetical protein
MSIFVGCASKPLILPHKEQDSTFNRTALAGKKLAIWIVDSLTLSADYHGMTMAKQYRYYIKRVMPEKISQQHIFSKVAFQYQIENGESIKWTNVKIAVSPQLLMLKVPVAGTRIDFPGDDYDFVLLIGNIDIQNIPKKLTEQVADIIEVAQNDPVQHALRYAIWDNNNGKIVEKGIAVVRTIELEKYLGTKRWEKLMANFAAEIFHSTAENQ